MAHRPPDPERVCHPARRRWPRRILWVLPSAAFGGFWGFAALYPLHYVAIRPGLSVNIGPRLSVAGGPDHPATGRVLFATVLLQRKITLFEALDGWRRESIDVYSERALFGDESPQQSVERQRAQMDTSKTVASIVAQRRLGFAARGEGARVISVGSGLPVAKVLHPGDVIMAVGGVRICLRDDARLGLKGHAPGDAVSVTVRRGGIGPEVTASFELAQDANTGAPLLGVEIETVRCRPPFEVTVDTDSVLGSSAGLAMTLAMIDRLSPGELTGSLTVATTGTIESDGAVGEVGGVKQKTIAVRAAGAKLFLVPAAELPEARRHAGSMRVVAVRTLDDALAALHAAGGALLPRGTTS